MAAGRRRLAEMAPLPAASAQQAALARHEQGAAITPVTGERVGGDFAEQRQGQPRAPTAESSRTAVAYVSRRFERLALVLGDTITYTLGRVVAYTLLAVLIRALSLEIARVANPLISVGEIVIGPLLILVGLFILRLIR